MLGNAEGEAGGRDPPVGPDEEVAAERALADSGLDVIGEAGLVAVCEHGSGLDAGRTQGEGGSQPVGRGLAAGDPHRQSEGNDRGDVDLVALAVDRLAQAVEGTWPARWGVVTAGAGALDHEAVGARGWVGDQAAREVVGGDDGQHERDGQRGDPGDHRTAAEQHSVGPSATLLPMTDGEADVLPGGQPAHERGDVGGVARADEHDVHPGQQGTETGGRQRQVDLVQVVDADQPLMALLGQEDLDEVGGDGGEQLLTGGDGVPRHRAVRLCRRDPAVDEVGGQDPLGDPGHREGGQRAPNVPTGVAILEPAGAHDVERRARDHRAGRPRRRRAPAATRRRPPPSRPG